MPVCDAYNYCPECGQHLKWGNNTKESTVENKEWQDRYYGSGWILVDENNLPEGEVLGCNIKGSMMVGKIKKVKDGDIRVASFYGMMGCIAYMPLPEPYHPQP